MALDPRTERAILLITTRFRDSLTWPDIAAEVGVSPFHLHRLFKADTGETPAAYLARIRLDHAAHLMVVLPDAPLVQIAFESGFTSAATFARAFRQHFQQTASGYRREKRLAVKSDPLAPKLSLQQLPSRRLRVQRCALEEGALTNAYRALAQRRLVSPCVMLGIFVDAPFHQDRASCRHYLALESERTDAAADAFELPGGLYASVSIAGDLDALSQAILRFKTDVLDPSPYAIGSTLAFERVLLPGTAADFDYRRSEREVFIKVRRKLEPVI